MEHEFAISTHAVERYLTGDMSAGEREAFEAHYFACPDCAADLKVTARFIENAKAVWSEQLDRTDRISVMDWLRSKWLSPAAVAAAAAACAILIFQNAMVIPQLKAPRALPALTLDLASRSALPHLAPGDPLHFVVALEHSAATPMIFVALNSESGAVLRSGAVVSPRADQPLDVYFPGTIKPGRYIITIRSYTSGQPGELVARQAFAVGKEQELTIP